MTNPIQVGDGRGHIFLDNALILRVRQNTRALLVMLRDCGENRYDAPKFIRFLDDLQNMDFESKFFFIMLKDAISFGIDKAKEFISHSDPGDVGYVTICKYLEAIKQDMKDFIHDP